MSIRDIMTVEEENRLNALSKRYADNGYNEKCLNEEEWNFVREICERLADSNKPA